MVTNGVEPDKLDGDVGLEVRVFERLLKDVTKP